MPGKLEQAAILASMPNRELAKGLRALAEDIDSTDPSPFEKSIKSLVAMTITEAAIRLENNSND